MSTVTAKGDRKILRVAKFVLPARAEVVIDRSI